MGRKSTAAQYGSVAIAVHWSSAAAVVLAFLAGLVLANSAVVPVPLLIAHILLGVTVFALTLLRVAWWLVADRHPVPPREQPRWQQLAARVVHVLVYALLILMGISGIVTILLSGAIPAVLSGAALPDLSGLLPRVAHDVMSKLLLVLLAGHIGAALYHQFIRKDQLLARMGLGSARN